MWTGSSFTAGLACLLTVASAACAEPLRPQMPAARGSAAFSSRLLADHNAERQRKGAVPLEWSPLLAQEAQSWAERLAHDDRMYHSDRATRRGAGENLWSGTSGYFSADDMLGAFLGERKAYKPGIFPDVSKTGRWQDVGHYTQVIWPGTQQVGCAVSHNKAREFLVCRYWPAGNVFGHAVN
jgi:hypothetical protein